MRINLIDITKPFDHYSKVLRDMAAVYFPGVFLRGALAGLAEPHSKEEVSFARFVVTAFTFCAQPMEDLVFDLVSFLRNNTSLEPSAQLSAHSLREVVRVLCADFPATIVKDIVCNRCACVESNSHIDIMHAMRLSQKYPLMFFQLVRFQRLARRLIFGDKFWEGRVLFEASRFEAEFAKYFQVRDKGKDTIGSLGNQLRSGPPLDIREATKRTGRSIVSDFWACRGNVTELFPYYSSEIDQNSTTVSPEVAILLKDVMGPRAARELLEAAELSVASAVAVAIESMAGPTEDGAVPEEEEGHMLRFRDEASGSDFVYIPASGERAWVRRVLQGGRLLKERLEFRPPPQGK
jgi:hypothetical protein